MHISSNGVRGGRHTPVCSARMRSCSYSLSLSAQMIWNCRASLRAGSFSLEISSLSEAILLSRNSMFALWNSMFASFASCASLASLTFCISSSRMSESSSGGVRISLSDSPSLAASSSACSAFMYISL